MAGMEAAEDRRRTSCVAVESGGSGAKRKQKIKRCASTLYGNFQNANLAMRTTNPRCRPTLFSFVLPFWVFLHSFLFSVKKWGAEIYVGSRLRFRPGELSPPRHPDSHASAEPLPLIYINIWTHLGLPLMIFVAEVSVNVHSCDFPTSTWY